MFEKVFLISMPVFIILVSLTMAVLFVIDGSLGVFFTTLLVIAFVALAAAGVWLTKEAVNSFH